MSRPKSPKVLLGTIKGLVFDKPIQLSIGDINTHIHIIGVSGAGKSRFIAGLILELMKAGLALTLLDPHGDLARLILCSLVAQGKYKDKEAFEKLIYLDLPKAEQKKLYFPFNVLKLALPAHTIASNIKEAFHRAWPALAQGAAPMFDTLIQDAVKVLVSNKLPLSALYRFLISKPFRNRLLENEEDTDIVSYFHEQFDRLSARDQADQAGSALRRAHLLTFSPVLKYSLGQEELLLDFRKLIDEGKSTIINLALPDADARRLLGCLLTVLAEQGALSRASLPPQERFEKHHLVLDEFAEFTAQSEQALERVLNLCRKYGLYLVMAHQNWSQASKGLRGALQNVGLEVAFKLGRDDAEQEAKILGRVNLEAIKHEVDDSNAAERTHPLYSPVLEQWEALIQEIQDLKSMHFIAKTGKGLVIYAKSIELPDPVVDEAELERVEEEYLKRYFTPEAEIQKRLSLIQEDEVTLKRVEKVEEQ